MILSELWLLTTEIGDQYSENRKLYESNAEIKLLCSNLIHLHFHRFYFFTFRAMY